jgi:hypothetical protein
VPHIDPAIVVQNDGYSTVKGQKLTVAALNGVLSNDFDHNDLSMNAVLVTGSKNGTVKLSADGSFTFTPKSTFTGTTSFTYKVTDGLGTSTTATATIVVSKTLVSTGGPAGGILGAHDDAVDWSALFSAAHDGAGNHDHRPLTLLVDLLDHDDHGEEGPLDVHDMPAPAGWLPDIPDHLHHSHSEFALG